jgi:triosephosphate isomerase
MAAAQIRPLVAGNWKMNGLSGSNGEFEKIVGGATRLAGRADLMVCPPFTLISRFASAAGAVAVGGQDCHPQPSGAHTGDIATEMLADAGAKAVIVGHSERRADHHESDALVRAKALAAWRAGLTAIVCVGETRAQREAGETLRVVGGQLAGSLPDSATGANLVVAYEPVWAIGTGEVATPEDAQEVCAALRTRLAELYSGDLADHVRILYGGSVKASNIAGIMAQPDVDGALVGGASLDAGEFAAICQFHRTSVDVP